VLPTPDSRGDLFSKNFSKNYQVIFICPMRAEYSTCLIVLGLNTVITFGECYKLGASRAEFKVLIAIFMNILESFGM
jgi:hypothetical protein